MFFLLPLYVIYNFVYLKLTYCDITDAHSGDAYCDTQYYFNILTLMCATLVAQIYIFTGSVMVSLVGLAYGTEVAYQLTNSWVERFSDLRKVTVSGSQYANSSSESAESEQATSIDQTKTDETVSLLQEHNAPNSSISSSCSDDAQFAKLISTDAYEHYLFIQEYMRRAGELWSPAIMGFVLFLLFLIAAYGYVVLDHKEEFLNVTNIALVCAYIGVRICILLVYPIMSIARANACIYPLQDVFKVSSPADYAIIGGRDNWTTFLSDVPIAWSIYGFWVTWDRLFGLLWAVLTGVIAVIVTVLTNFV